MNNILVSLPNLASVSDLQRDYSALLNKVNKTNTPLFLLRNNNTEGVLLSPHLFEELVSQIRHYEEQYADDVIENYKKEKKNKKLTKLKSIDNLFEE